MNNLRWKSVFRWDKGVKRLRLFRVMWEQLTPDGVEYSSKLSVAIDFKLEDFWLGVFWSKELFGAKVWICLLPCVPLRIHLQQAWGGRFV